MCKLHGARDTTTATSTTTTTTGMLRGWNLQHTDTFLKKLCCRNDTHPNPAIAMTTPPQTRQIHRTVPGCRCTPRPNAAQQSLHPFHINYNLYIHT